MSRIWLESEYFTTLCWTFWRGRLDFLYYLDCRNPLMAWCINVLKAWYSIYGNVISNWQSWRHPFKAKFLNVTRNETTYRIWSLESMRLSLPRSDALYGDHLTTKNFRYRLWLMPTNCSFQCSLSPSRFNSFLQDSCAIGIWPIILSPICFYICGHWDISSKYRKILPTLAVQHECIPAMSDVAWMHVRDWSFWAKR
jgi:hypothetical protein